jgi:hypothetical protein
MEAIPEFKLCSKKTKKKGKFAALKNGILIMETEDKTTVQTTCRLHRNRFMIVLCAHRQKRSGAVSPASEQGWSSP